MRGTVRSDQPMGFPVARSHAGDTLSPSIDTRRLTCKFLLAYTSRKSLLAYDRAPP